MSNKITDETVKELVRMYIAGELRKNICVDLCISKTSLDNLIQKLNLPRRALNITVESRLSSSQKRALVRDYKAGLTVRCLCLNYKLGRESLYRFLRTRGVKMRIQITKKLLRWKRGQTVMGCVTLVSATKHYSWVIVRDKFGYVASCRSSLTGETYFIDNRKHIHSLKKIKEACEEKANLLERG